MLAQHACKDAFEIASFGEGGIGGVVAGVQIGVEDTGFHLGTGGGALVDEEEILRRDAAGTGGRYQQATGADQAQGIAVEFSVDAHGLFKIAAAAQ